MNQLVLFPVLRRHVVLRGRNGRTRRRCVVNWWRQLVVQVLRKATSPAKPKTPPPCACCGRPTSRLDDLSYYAYCDVCSSGDCWAPHPWDSPPERRPAPVKLRCRLAWHRWSTWGAPAAWVGMRYSVESGFGATLIHPDPVKVSEIRQQRACPDCGRVQIRVVKPQRGAL